MRVQALRVMRRTRIAELEEMLTGECEGEREDADAERGSGEQDGHE